MICRLSLVSLPRLFALLAIALAAPAYAQSNAGIADGIRGSTDPAAVSAAVQPFVRKQAADLASENPATTAAARETLMLTMSSPQNKAVFIDQMGRSIASEFNTLLARQNLPVHIRLNAAIVAAKVADVGRANSVNTALSLEDSVLRFINDPNEAVVIWGLKAAASTLPEVMNNTVRQRATKLPDAIAATVGRFPQSAAIAEEAFKALFFDMGGRQVTLPAPAIQSLVAAVHKLEQERLNIYLANELPVMPGLDGSVINFLVNTTWRAQTPEQQKTSVRQIFSLMHGAAQQLATRPQTDRVRPDLARVVNFGGSAFRIVAESGHPQLSQPAAAATELRNVSASDEYTAAVNALRTALQAAFPDIEFPQ